MKERNVIILTLGIGAFITLVATLFFMNHSTKHTTSTPMPWMSEVQNNKVITLGITLGESPIRTLMATLGSEAEVALFKDKASEENTLEVYFSNAKIGGLSARVIANLSPTRETLEFLNTQVKEYEILPTGNEKVLFHGFANNQLLSLPVEHLSIIPYSNLDITNIKQLFGTPDEETEEYLLYPKRGLKVVLSGKLIILEFSNVYLHSI